MDFKYTEKQFLEKDGTRNETNHDSRCSSSIREHHDMVKSQYFCLISSLNVRVQLWLHKRTFPWAKVVQIQQPIESFALGQSFNGRPALEMTKPVSGHKNKMAHNLAFRFPPRLI